MRVLDLGTHPTDSTDSIWSSEEHVSETCVSAMSVRDTSVDTTVDTSVPVPSAVCVLASVPSVCVYASHIVGIAGLRVTTTCAASTMRVQIRMWMRMQLSG